MNLHHSLQMPFPVNVVNWRVGATNKDKTQGIALAYIDARDVMKRLDDVLGAENWQCRYPFAGCCEIGIKIGKEWVWKANGAGETDFEGAKGQYSDAFKRAAVMWGIARYLYALPAPWVPIKPVGRSYAISGNPPKLPTWATPEGFTAIADERESINHAEQSIDGTRVDIGKLRDVVNEAVRIVDEDDMDSGPRQAREIYEPLTKDERMWVNGQLREKTFNAEDTGRERQYWTAFKAYLEAAA